MSDKVASLEEDAIVAFSPCDDPSECNNKDLQTDNNPVKNAAHWRLGTDKIEETWYLVDHPELWAAFDHLEGFSGKLREISLRQRSKYEILQLPDATLVARQFYCGMCNEIPFPRKGTPAPLAPPDYFEPAPYPNGVFLCTNGHAICRACRQCCFTCALSKADLVYMNGNSNTTVNLSSLKEQAEFACQYYYDWCSFRGQGKNLQEHEDKCEFRRRSSKDENNDKKPTQPENVTVEQSDDAYILQITQSTLISATIRFLNSVDPYWNLKNVRNVGQSKGKKK